MIVSRPDGAGSSERLIATPLDVRDRAAVAAAVRRVAERWQRIDVLINNAGLSGQNPIDADGSGPEEKWLDIVDTNLTGTFYMTRACLPYIPRGGRIINISSVLGKFGVAGYSAYCASKHGVIGLTRALSEELAARQITVNAICPGWVDTAMAREGVQEMADKLGIEPERFRAAAMERVPLGRFLRPEEIGPLVLYIASPEAEAMTGQAINLEGGATTW